MSLSESQKNTLFRVARESIASGLRQGCRFDVDLEHYDVALRVERASFVTLRIRKKLRGCIGSLEAKCALVADVAANAHSAAFSDPRFQPLVSDELPQLRISIAVLTRSEPIEFSCEADLVRQLRPGIDGVILEEGNRRATLIPAAWSHVESSDQFVRQLKIKAGLSSNHWSETLQFRRYQAESFTQHEQ